LGQKKGISNILFPPFFNWSMTGNIYNYFDEEIPFAVNAFASNIGKQESKKS
jgi:hypothetical protein